MTTWESNCCKCIIEYDATEKVTKIINKCIRHANESTSTIHTKMVSDCNLAVTRANILQTDTKEQQASKINAQQKILYNGS